MMKTLALAAACIFCAQSIHAGDLPKFETDQAADTWLREHSPLYRSMVGSLEMHGGYGFASSKEIPRALTVPENGRVTIKLNEAIHGPERVSLAIFELTNAYQLDKFRDLELEVQTGVVKDASEYAILRALIEMDGLRIHRRILGELDKTLGGVPKEMFQWIRPDALTLESYELPPAFDYIRAQQNSSYRASYEQLFRQAEAKKKSQTPLNLLPVVK
jgi:hypothetical protein